ncbi:MAG TPA: protein kinase [Polyangia bacterium]|nr:protein kinase [Polyangia bacterium]
MVRDCLTESTILAFVEGGLAAPRRSEVEAHLAICSACTELVTWTAAEASDPRTRALSGAETRRTAGTGRLAPLEPGARVGRYQILGSVGRGGMGEVYAAYHPDLDRRIALKVVHESGVTETAERQARLLREARSIARLTHPNVVAVYDAGTVADRVYVAMEFVEGVTIDRWLAAEPRTWRQILDVFVAAGRGLAAAHAAGIVHRDFKPQNVMIARDGSVRVMDFGLARMTAAEPAIAPVLRALVADAGAGDAAPEPAPTVTVAGTIVGTPAYMAPEQFRGEPADARSDQFSFCVALYEALFGERPFAGENLLSLRMNVSEGELRVPRAAKRGEIPIWIRRPLFRGLRPDPDQRHPTMTPLIDALAQDPAVRRRRFVGAGAIAAAIIASVAFTWQATSRRRAAAEQEIARQIDDAAHASASARANAAEATALRRQAFDAFDHSDRRGGEELWRKARGVVSTTDADYDRAERNLDAAYMLDQGRAQHRSALADLRLEHLLFAEDFRLANKVTILEERLAAVDADGSRRKRLAAPGTLALRTTPTAARIALERYDRDPVTGRRSAVAVRSLATAPSATNLSPGSYRLLIDGDGLAHVAYPFEIGRAQRVDVGLALPAAKTIPKGFVYVAPGAFLFGDADEQFRTQFLDAVPIHRRETSGYLIARNETTIRDWITFLDDLPAAERTRRTPASGAGTYRGALSLRRGTDGWRIALKPAARMYKAATHESINYVGRSRQSRQDWLQFPIGGVSPDDMARYLAWMRETGRLPGARLCSELEWERAARGADDRLFPNGDELVGDDANIDITYDRIDDAFGPDEIGAHPASRSPFEINDLAGNAFELVASDTPEVLFIRGGGYYFAASSARSTNHERAPRTIREAGIGLRVCADAPTTAK